MAEREPVLALRVKGLRFSRSQSDGNEFLLDVPVMEVMAGQVVALVGPSGSGKSTLLNLVSALESPDSGKVEINFGTGLVPLSNDFEHARVGRIFQDGHLLPAATVAANVALGLASSEDELGKVDRTKLATAIAQLGLPESALDRPVWQLSGGQQQRVAIARALISDPTIIRADEPTSSLDPDLARGLMAQLRRWVKDAPENSLRTVLWVTHDYSLVVGAADALFVVKSEQQGELIQSGLNEPSGVPEPVPGSAAEIEAMVGTTGRTNGQDAKIATSSIHGWQSLGWSLSISQMLQRRGRSSPNELTQVLSLPRENGGWRLPLASLFAAFSEWSLFARLLIAIMVGHGLLVLWAIQEHQTRTVLESPDNCHTIISGTSAELNLTPGELQALAEGPWREDGATRDFGGARDVSFETINAQMSAVTPGMGCHTTFVAWPRRDLGVAAWTPLSDLSCSDSATDENGELRRRRLQASIMHRGEPVLEAMTAWDGTPVARAFRERDLPTERLAAIVSIYTSDRIFGLSPEALEEIGHLCLERPGLGDGEPIKVPIIAVADGLPRDGDFYFDIILPMEAMERRTAALQGQNYRQIALYFQADELGAVSDYLDRTGSAGGGVRYRYDPDAIERFRAAVDVNLVIVSAILTVCALVVVGNLLMVVASLSTVIQGNRRAIAMQLAMGVQARVLWGAIRGFIAIILVMAILAGVILAAFAWVSALLLEAVGSTLASNLLAIGLGNFAGAFVISTLVTAFTCAVAFFYSTRATRDDMYGRLAQILQSGA
ncbi:MAG: ATP-binding cassette domain-containing protein [Fimbriimonadaceae bacterium]|nr:ATP-binding cassette domain-containing protein [Alphaproteobacteria bacterium]